MTLCSKCSSLVLVDLWNNDVVFHENLQALVQSAEQRCAFCRLCWTRIQQNFTPASVQLCLAASSSGPQISGVAIYITGELHPGDPVPNGSRASCFSGTLRTSRTTVRSLTTQLPGRKSSARTGTRFATASCWCCRRT
ncbi:hypothetical protein B0H63DRAFT_468186 [Podospora didyma]|uniref:Uncharacterized protein n=1 Tax=Podospora didyma TaxID=330526 RepID=A0AAE0U0T0_9PEZI|nr:hypothetical protein B0H63DRAFT_468186 [Podospora didyma]